MKATLQNVAVTHPQLGWITMGLPDNHPTKYGKFVIDGQTDGFRAMVNGKELFTHVELGPNQKVTGTFIEDSTLQFTHQMSDWVGDELHKLVPSFGITRDGRQFYSDPIQFWDGVSAKPSAYFIVEEATSARIRIRFLTRIQPQFITIEGWFDIFSLQDQVPFEIRATYGHTQDQHFLNQQFGSLQMYTGEAAHVYHAKRKGIRPRILRTDLGMWETELVSPRVWLRARTYECVGNLLCMPAYDKVAEARAKDPVMFDKRYYSLLATEQAPLCGVADVWDGHWLSYNVKPKNPETFAAIAARAYNDMVSDINRGGDELDPRRYGQPPNSGQTGEQPDFGASKCELAVSMNEPWALWEYRFSVQAWMLRPYANKEPNGSPIKASAHPMTKTYNRRPDNRFSPDMLGWPNPVPYFEHYGTSDDEHRSDNLLLGMYALTRSPSIKATILDLIELEKLNINLMKAAAPIGAPRGWGRPLLSLSHMLSLGFRDVEPLIRFYVEYLRTNAAMYEIPQLPDRTVRTLSRNGAKYGWTNLNGSPVYPCWIPWEESIAAMALWAIYKDLGIIAARDMALEIAKTICNHAFFKQNNQWFACYAVRWDADNPGKPLPQSSYTLTNPPELNKDVFVYGMQTWMIPSLMMLDSSTPEGARAREIINFFAPGGTPRNLTESGWWAV